MLVGRDGVGDFCPANSDYVGGALLDALPAEMLPGMKVCVMTVKRVTRGQRLVMCSWDLVVVVVALSHRS